MRLQKRAFILAALIAIVFAMMSMAQAQASAPQRPHRQDETATPTLEDEATETPTDDSSDPTATPTRKPAATKTPSKAPTKAKATATPTGPAYTDGGELALDEAVKGTIDAKNPGYRYTYEGKEQEEITITLETSKGLSAYMGLFLFSKTGAKFEDGNIYQDLTVKANSSDELTVTLPEETTYYVIVGPSGSSKGAFTLTLTSSAGNGGGGNKGDAPEKIETTGTSKTVVAGLNKLDLVPTGGKQVLNIDNSFGKTSDSGFSYLVLGRGLKVQDAVIQYTVSWNAAGDSSGCGFLFRSDDSGSNSMITLLTNDGYAVLYQFEGKDRPIEYDQESSLFTPGKPTVVTIIAIQETVTLYINGKLETQQKTDGTLTAGGFAVEVYNAKNNKVLTDCRYKNIWVWSFD